MVSRSVLSILAGFAAVVVSFLALGYLIFDLTGIGAVPSHSPEMHTPVSLFVSLLRLLAGVAIGCLVASGFSRRHGLDDSILPGCLMILLALFDGVPPEHVQPMWYTALTPALLIPAARGGALPAGAVERRR